MERGLLGMQVRPKGSASSSLALSADRTDFNDGWQPLTLYGYAPLERSQTRLDRGSSRDS